jgi:hypothetical protein
MALPRFQQSVHVLHHALHLGQPRPLVQLRQLWVMLGRVRRDALLGDALQLRLDGTGLCGGDGHPDLLPPLRGQLRQHLRLLPSNHQRMVEHRTELVGVRASLLLPTKLALPRTAVLNTKLSLCAEHGRAQSGRRGVELDGARGGGGPGEEHRTPSIAEKGEERLVGICEAW